MILIILSLQGQNRAPNSSRTTPWTSVICTILQSQLLDQPSFELVLQIPALSHLVLLSGCSILI